MISPPTTSEVVFFHTALGWMGVAFGDQGIQKLAFGNETREEVAARFELERMRIVHPNGAALDWIHQIKEYTQGNAYNFANLPLDLGKKTAFQQRVISECREIPHGATLSYRELASRAGSPGGARAAGTVMSKNNIPLIIPCHRVVSSNGLGGFSSPRGVGAKRQLLELEGNLEYRKKQKQLAI